MNAVTRTPPVPVVQMRDGVPVADSRDVARYFAKEHKAVLRSIRDAKCSPAFRERNFAPFVSNGLDGKEVTDYVLMTKSGFAFVVLAFTGDKAAPFREDYINAYDRMQAEFRSRPAPDRMVQLQDPRQLLQLLGVHAERTIALETTVARQGRDLQIAEHTIERQAATVEAHERITNADDSSCITDTAKRLGVSPRALFAYMRNPAAKVRWLLHRATATEETPHQDRINAGEMVCPVETVTVHPRNEAPRDKLVTRVRVTPKGLTRLAKLIVEGKDPLLPVPTNMLHVLGIARDRGLFD